MFEPERVKLMSYALQVGFSFFKEADTAQGLQNQMFSIFMLLYANVWFASSSSEANPRATQDHLRLALPADDAALLHSACTLRG